MLRTGRSVLLLLLSFSCFYFDENNKAHEGEKNPKAEQPTRTTVADYVKSDKSKKWVVLTDAKINLLNAVTVTTTRTTTMLDVPVKSEKNLSMLYIPIESAGSTQNDTVSLLLETDNAEILNVARQLMAKSEEKSGEQLLQFLTKERDKLIRSVALSGLMEKGGNVEIRKRIKNLAGDFYILKHNDSPKPKPTEKIEPGVMGWIGMFLFILFLFSLRRKKRRDDSQVQPATLPSRVAEHGTTHNCASCGSTINLFGGKKYGEYYFCNDECINQLSKQAAEEIVEEVYIHEIHQGSCPKCHGPGPVDVHTSYWVWSLVLFTSWNSRPQICCQSCGTKSKMEDALFSLVCGWWGIPFGVLITPLQIIRNVVGLFTSPDPLKPSQQLKTMIKQHFGR